MEKSASFWAGVRAALEKEAAFGKKPVEGAVKTIAGVTKTFRGGKWVAPSSPSSLSSLAAKARGLFSPKSAPIKPVRLSNINVAKARGLGGYAPA